MQSAYTGSQVAQKAGVRAKVGGMLQGLIVMVVIIGMRFVNYEDLAYDIVPYCKDLTP